MNHPIVSGHAAVRAALRDPARYSSDLQGDRDVRSYKQLPLEVDPPIHALYRSILTPMFSADRVASLLPQFRTVADALVRELRESESFNVCSELALEMVVRCLGVVLNRPGDVDQWRSWGPDVWINTPEGRTGEHLQRYLEQTFAEVTAHPDTDAFSVINQAAFDGRELTTEEKHGIANIILAGGRDTVVKVLTGFMWYLGNNPEQAGHLAANRGAIARAIDEMVRWLSPLPMMERIDTSNAGAGDEPAYTWISFASANHDPAVFTNPESIDLARHPNPHMGFGGGPHACVGNQVAKAETRALLEALFDAGCSWHIVDENIDWTMYGHSRVPGRFHSVTAVWNR